MFLYDQLVLKEFDQCENSTLFFVFILFSFYLTLFFSIRFCLISGKLPFAVLQEIEIDILLPVLSRGKRLAVSLLVLLFHKML